MHEFGTGIKFRSRNLSSHPPTTCNKVRMNELPTDVEDWEPIMKVAKELNVTRNRSQRRMKRRNP
jgi:hypothetical protein